MHKIRGNKWNRRISKWIASLLTVTLLVNQNCFLVLAEESGEGVEKVCLCDTRCSADGVNEACPVCAEGYEKCAAAEDGTGEGSENPDAGDGENTGTGTETTPEETVPDAGTGEETENPDAGEDEGVNMDEDTEVVSDVDDEVNTLLVADESENVAEDDAVSPASVGDTFTDNGFTYRITYEYKLQAEVIGHVDGTSVSGDLVIPSTASNGTKTYTVVRIGYGAFKNCSSLTSITISSGITSIESGAFQSCSSLVSITIPDGVTSIENEVFYECSSLASITIPNSVTSIKGNAFQGCSSLTSITIPGSVNSIGGAAFFECSSLTSVTILNGVTSIESGAFYGCSSLESITIPDSVTSIEMYTFYGCSSLESITIPNSVTSIGTRGFFGCSRLASITLSNSLTKIEKNTFYGCSSLESITIPDSVISIEDGAFDNCRSLKSITIPNGVTSIGGSAFYNCRSLESIIIPDSVTSIGNGAFWICSNLKSITIPSGVSSIGAATFMNCRNLNSFQIALTENITVTPLTIERTNCFEGCPDDRYLTFLTKDGTTVLNDTTTPTLAAAVKAYDKADGSKDGKWYGWKLPDVPDIPDHSVTIKVNKDDSEWSDCGKAFALSADNGVTFITDLTDVSNGTYTIYDITGASDSTGYIKTGVTVDVIDADTQAEVNYYTVTFYDGDTVFAEQIVPENEKVNAPSDPSEKDGYTFDGWAASEDGSTAFDFQTQIKAKTSIYAKWVKNEEETPPATGYPVKIKVNKDGSEWTDCEKLFALSADGVTFITDFGAVSNGTYTLYDITGASDSTGYVNTRVTIDVEDAAAQAEINYYSVTFYDDDTPFSGQIVPSNTTVSEPLPPPTKDGYIFYRWATSKDGSTEFDFNNPITAKTNIYASWVADAEELFTIKASAGAGGSVTPDGDVEVKSGANQQFAITPEDGYRIASVLVDGNEVLGSLQVINYTRAGGADVENNTRYYIFENVTGNHTLAAYFETITTDGDGSEGSGGGDNNDNSDSGGSGGGDTNDNSGSGGSGGSDSSDNGSSDNFGGSDASDNSGTGGSDGGDARNNTNGNGGSDSSGGNTSDTSSHTGVSADASVISISNTAPASKDKEPKTGYASYMEIYATIAMIAGLSYLLLYFADGKNGMTEEEKKEIVAALVKWAKNGSRIKKYAALAVIFLILVYYHSIGKRTTADWKEIYEK